MTNEKAPAPSSQISPLEPSGTWGGNPVARTSPFTVVSSGQTRLIPAQLFCPGQVPYALAWQWQQYLVSQRKQNPDLPDVLIMLEHPPVYTLGKGSSLNFLKFNPEVTHPHITDPHPVNPPQAIDPYKIDPYKIDPYTIDPSKTSVELYRTERGGEVTYHAPGQVVGYPILNLGRYCRDIHWYLRQLEAVLIQTIDRYGLPAERIEGLTGVWVKGRKVGFIGIKVSRWITMHGFSLNVCPDLGGFERIVPCGISDRPIGSLAQFISPIPIEQVQQDIIEIFAEVFRLSWEPFPGFGEALVL